MIAAKFDIDSSSLVYDRHTRALAMTVQPIVAEYDESALLMQGWGVMAGCPELRRLVVTVEVDDDVAVPLRAMPMRRAA